MTNNSWNLMSSNTTTVNTILAAPNYVLAVFLSLAQLFGVLVNILVIYSIVNQRSLLKSNYYFLVLHLAFCDLMVLLLISYNTYGAWNRNYSFIRSFSMCKVWEPMTTMFLDAGIYLVVVIGIFRFRAVLHPLKPAVSRSRLRVVVGVLYFCAIASLVPLVLVLKFTDVCFPEWPNPKLNIIYTFFLTTVQYFLPVLILFILYYNICKALNIQSRKTLSLNATSAATSEDSNGRQTSLQRIKHYRNVRTFIQSASIVVLFAITSLPFQISWLLFASGATLQFQAWTYILSLFGVNPYIYGVSDKTLRAAYKRIWEKVKRILVSSSSKTDLYVAVSFKKTWAFVKISEYLNVSVMLLTTCHYNNALRSTKF